MKKIMLGIMYLLISHAAICQQTEAHKTAIKNVLNTFMTCLKEKDSTKFYDLFYNGQVAWVGDVKARSASKTLEKSKDSRTYFIGDYKKFYRKIADQGRDEEKFEKIVINGDESIASVIFDYSFWEDKKVTNWGKESWGLVNINGEWKITSIIFSIELAEYGGVFK